MKIEDLGVIHDEVKNAEDMVKQAKELETILGDATDDNLGSMVATVSEINNEEQKEPWANLGSTTIQAPIGFGRDCDICGNCFDLSNQYDTRRICPDCIHKLRVLLGIEVSDE